MVQIKVSTVLLATVIASLSAPNSVLAKRLNGDVGYQRSEYQDPVIRAIAHEVLYGRSEPSLSGYSSLSSRGEDLATRDELGAIPRFFRDVGGVVKRMFTGYWRDMEDTAGLFDLREYYHKKHERRAALSSTPSSEETGTASKESSQLKTRHHMETDQEAHTLHSTKRLRRRLNFGEIDDGLDGQPTQANKMRRRMDFDRMVRGSSIDSDDFEARTYNPLRRRMDYDHMVTRDSGDLEARSHNHLRRRMDYGEMVTRDVDDLEARSHNHLRRRMDYDQMVTRDSSSSDDLEARDGHIQRRRMNFDQIARAYDGDSDDLELRDEELGLLPRMSWFGESFLIYRDMQNKARLEARSDELLFDRDLVGGLHDEW